MTRIYIIALMIRNFPHAPLDYPDTYKVFDSGVQELSELEIKTVIDEAINAAKCEVIDRGGKWGAIVYDSMTGRIIASINHSGNSAQILHYQPSWNPIKI